MALRRLLFTSANLSPVGRLGPSQQAFSSWGWQLPPPRRFVGPLPEQKESIEMLWREFFSDPKQWWDNRTDEGNARYPDFTHKRTRQPLWVNDKWTPSWVQSELNGLRDGDMTWSRFVWCKKLLKLVKSGQYQMAVKLFQQMQDAGLSADSYAFVQVLRACASLKAIEQGRIIHALIEETGCEANEYVATCLVDMYARSGCMEDAEKVFETMSFRPVTAWNALIVGYVHRKEAQKALELHQRMQKEKVEPNSTTFVGALNACAALGGLKEGRRVHNEVIQKSALSDPLVGNSLIDMYSKCGSIEDAWAVFSGLPVKSVVGWSAMILGLSKCGKAQQALSLYQQMRQERVDPNASTFVAALNAVSTLGAIDEGRLVHKDIIAHGCETDIFVGSSLVDMYAKCGSLEDAWRIFSRMPMRNVVAWSALISALVSYGHGQKALEFYRRMQAENVQPNPVTFVGVLTACASLKALEEGRRIHQEIITVDSETNCFVGSSLVDMYAKCGSIVDACKVFNKMRTRNVVAWSAMILGHVKCEQPLKAWELFKEMQVEGVEPNAITFVAALKACSRSGSLEDGRLVHRQICERGLESELFVGSSLIAMYAKCRSPEDAWKIFQKMALRDVVTWTAMIQCYVKCGESQRALALYREMQGEGVAPDLITFRGVLTACSDLAALEEGKVVHMQLLERGFVSDVHINNQLVDMYAKCGSMDDAQRVFDEMLIRTVTAWTSLIFGYARDGQGKKALDIFWQMQAEGFEPSRITFAAALNACASTVALEKGRQIHESIIRRGYESDLLLGSSLVDMYSKCGSVGEATTIFERLPRRDVVAWTAMLGGYAVNGHGKEALQHFERMLQAGIPRNEVTLTCLLTACAHSGLVDEGRNHFESMATAHNVLPTVEHFTCMTALLGRAGRLHEAEDLIQSCVLSKMDSTSWTSLLGACKAHENLQLGEQVVKRVLELDPRNAAGYVLLSNIYAAAKLWDLRASVQQERWRMGIKKQPGRTWIEVDNEVHSFLADDQDHPKIVEIHNEVGRLFRRIEDAGYVPHVRSVLHDLDEDGKAHSLRFHSEKLAVAYGLISTPPDQPLLLFKNLQVCVDCHTAFKFISKLYRRSINVRDGNRFHHFKDGFCSCGDYW